MIKLINGDCLQEMRNIEKVDFVVTSPPYNRKRNDKYNNYEDTKSEYFEFLVDSTELMMRKSDYVFLNIQQNMYNKADVFKLFGYHANYIINVISWTKSNPMPASGFNVTNSHEFILILSYYHKTIKAKKTYTKNHIHTNVYSSNPHKKIHRAVMHPDIPEYIIDRFIPENKTVLDPFMGVGTTGKSCLNNNINFVGIELDNQYYDVAKKELIEEKK
jgi:site-specific DNA-methyltransferase (adenine-specific)